MATTWTLHQLATLVLAMLGTGAITGIPIGVWIARIPVPAPPPSDEELAALADGLDHTAALLRARAHQRPQQ